MNLNHTDRFEYYYGQWIDYRREINIYPLAYTAWGDVDADWLDTFQSALALYKDWIEVNRGLMPQMWFIPAGITGSQASTMLHKEQHMLDFFEEQFDIFLEDNLALFLNYANDTCEQDPNCVQFYNPIEDPYCQFSSYCSWVDNCNDSLWELIQCQYTGFGAMLQIPQQFHNAIIQTDWTDLSDSVTDMYDDMLWICYYYLSGYWVIEIACEALVRKYAEETIKPRYIEWSIENDYEIEENDIDYFLNAWIVEMNNQYCSPADIINYRCLAVTTVLSAIIPGLSVTQRIQVAKVGFWICNYMTGEIMEDDTLPMDNFIEIISDESNCPIGFVQNENGNCVPVLPTDECVDMVICNDGSCEPTVADCIEKRNENNMFYIALGLIGVYAIS